jgi:hypothetical protein
MLMYHVKATRKAISVAFLDWIARTYPNIGSINRLPPERVVELQDEFEQSKKQAKKQVTKDVRDEPKVI